MEKLIATLGAAGAQRPPENTNTLESIKSLTNSEALGLISISIGVVGIIFALVPIFLYFSEKRKSKLLEGTIEQFAILEQIQKKEEQVKEKLKKGNAEAKQQKELLDAMREDIENRLPSAALAAYYENTIPQIQQEILEWGERLKHMVRKLNEIQGSSIIINDDVKKILSEQISGNVKARRLLEQRQFYLVICTAIFSVLVSVVPYPISVILAVPLAMLTITICYKLIETAQTAYPENKTLARLASRSKILFIFIPAAILFIVAISVAIFSLLYYRFY